MNLLSMYKPSLDRIYGSNLPELRSSYQAILLVLAGLEELIMKGTPEERDSKLNALVGCTQRHFEMQTVCMQERDYYNVNSHADKHHDFLQTVEMFCLNFRHLTAEQNYASFRNIQKWLLHHLLMDDAHFMSQCFK